LQLESNLLPVPYSKQKVAILDFGEQKSIDTKRTPTELGHGCSGECLFDYIKLFNQEQKERRRKTGPSQEPVLRIHDPVLF
jgi:hypothetical protein